MASSGSGRARAGRCAPLPAALGVGLPLGVAVAATVGLARRRALPEGSPAFEAVADHGWGLRALLATARRLTDHDGDGFSARFGGGDCDDTRADVYPGAEDIPGDGIDQDCEGGDAKPRRAGGQGRPSTDAAPRTPRRWRPFSRAPMASRETSSSSPSTPSGPTGWGSRGTAGRPGIR